MTKEYEVMIRVYCRNCQMATDFRGNGCFCRGRLHRVCAGDRYGHPITYCRGWYRPKGMQAANKYRVGEVFAFRGVKLRVCAYLGAPRPCAPCYFSRLCAREDTAPIVQEAVGSCRAQYYEQINK